MSFLTQFHYKEHSGQFHAAGAVDKGPGRRVPLDSGPGEDQRLVREGRGTEVTSHLSSFAMPFIRITAQLDKQGQF